MTSFGKSFALPPGTTRTDEKVCSGEHCCGNLFNTRTKELTHSIHVVLILGLRRSHHSHYQTGATSGGRKGHHSCGNGHALQHHLQGLHLPQPYSVHCVPSGVRNQREHSHVCPYRSRKFRMFLFLQFLLVFLAKASSIIDILCLPLSNLG